MENEIPADRKFVFIAALPKSASSLGWLIASALQEPSWRAEPNRCQMPLPDPFLPLSDEAVRYFPGGGVYKAHWPLNHVTRSAIGKIRPKVVVLLRHPADFVASLYCHLLAEGAQAKTPAFEDVFGPVPPDLWHMPIDAALGGIISGGLLFGALEWMAAWAQFAACGESMLVTYEELLSDFSVVIYRLSGFIRGEAPTEDVLHYLDHVRDAMASEGRDKAATYYPRGWTGFPGVWHKYLSTPNVRRYRRTVRRFMATRPDSAHLRAIYPDLLISGSSFGFGFGSWLRMPSRWH